MITEVKDYYILYRISRLIDKGLFEGIGYSADDFLKYLMDKTETDKIKVFASIENNKINGFAVCSLAKDIVRDKPQVFIDLAYIEPKSNGTGALIMKKIEEYARFLKVNELCGYSLRGEKSMFKKYGFNLDYRVYIKKLEVENAIQKEKD